MQILNDTVVGELEAFLARHENLIITTHESPDPDGLGAEVGLYELLTRKDKHVFIVNGDPLPEKYTFLDPDGNITLAADFVPPANISEFGIIIVDTNTFQNTGATYTLLQDKISEFLIIDHHEGTSDVPASNLVLVDASSASEIVTNLFFHYDVPLQKKAAWALYSGIMFDTGNFRYAKTTPNTFYTAKFLVEAGAIPNRLYELMYENNDISILKLRAKMLSTLELHHHDRLAMMQLTPEMLQETKASFAEGELNIAIPLTMQGVIASVLIKQDVSGRLKVSMRSKGDLDVSIIAMARDGGGHKNAAGYKSSLTREQTRAQALNDLKFYFDD